jgi:hypothetical protein
MHSRIDPLCNLETGVERGLGERVWEVIKIRPEFYLLAVVRRYTFSVLESP